jgi:hypothetical protein
MEVIAMPVKPEEPGPQPAPQAAYAAPAAPTVVATRPALHPQITGLTFLTEMVVPGSSHLAGGRWIKGIGYFAVGAAVAAVAGFPATLLVSATSFTESVAGTDPLGLGKIGGALSKRPAVVAVHPPAV